MVLSRRKWVRPATKSNSDEAVGEHGLAPSWCSTCRCDMELWFPPRQVLSLYARCTIPLEVRVDLTSPMPKKQDPQYRL